MSFDGTQFTLIVREAGVDDGMVEAALPPRTSFRTIELAASTAHIEAALAETQPDMLVVACASSTERALDVVKLAHERFPHCATVVLATGSPNGFMQRAFVAGADDLFTLPASEVDLAFALKKALARRRGDKGSRALGRMICILGPKGGTGKTLTACNLGVALATKGRRSVIVDIDLQFGDVGIALGLKPERTIYDLSVAPGRIDDQKVEAYLAPHESGTKVLLAPVRPDQASTVTIDVLRDVYDALRKTFDFVIVDTPPAFSPEVIASIDTASDLLVVGMLDALSLKDTKIGLETLALMGHDSGSVRLLLNRADTSVGISLDDVEAILGRRPDVFVPSDRAVPRAITQGLPIVTAEERSGPARAFSALADLYLAIDEETEKPTRAAAEADHRSSGRRTLLRRR